MGLRGHSFVGDVVLDLLGELRSLIKVSKTIEIEGFTANRSRIIRAMPRWKSCQYVEQALCTHNMMFSHSFRRRRCDDDVLESCRCIAVALERQFDMHALRCDDTVSKAGHDNAQRELSLIFPCF